MRVSFRQGIVRAPANFTDFISVSGNNISIVLTTGTVLIVTIADGNTDYLISERGTITNAWAAVPSSPAWLYWDLDLSSGTLTRGFTLLSPVVGATAPAAPANDQHWFDTNAKYMKVWNSTANKWQRRIRVFFAQWNGGSSFTSVSVDSPTITGTQVGGTLAVSTTAGNPLFDGAGNPLKKQDGTFFTTEDVAIAGLPTSGAVKFAGIIIEGEAQAPIPAYSVVRFSGYNQVLPASNLTLNSSVFGIVDVGATTGDLVTVTVSGLIENPLWDFSVVGAGIGDNVNFPSALTVNSQLFCSSTGSLTAVEPTNGIPVAIVVSKSAILIRPASLFADSGADYAAVDDVGGVFMSVAPADPLMPIAVGDNDPRMLEQPVDTTGALTGAILRYDGATWTDDVLTSTTGLVAHTSPNVYQARTLTAPVAGITITDGDGVAGNPTLVLANDLSAIEGLASTGVAVRTAADTWTTRTVTGTATRIDVSNGDGVAGNPTIDLATVVDSGTGTFLKVTVDGYGRVTGTEAVVDTDITALVDAEYVNVSGDTMAGNLAMNGNKVIGLAAATANGDAVRYDEFSSHTDDVSIHFTLPITQGDVTNLVTDLASKYDEIIAVDGNLATFASNGAVLADSGVDIADVVVSGDIGTTVQAWDADLDAVASIGTGDGFIQRTSGVWSAAALTGSQVNTALGYTAANDSLTVHLAGVETITGDKTITGRFVARDTGDTTDMIRTFNVDLSLQGGPSGSVNVFGGSRNSGAGGSVNIIAGTETTAGSGGDVLIQSGAGIAGGAGGSIQVLGATGVATNGDGGSITLSTGSGNGTGSGGDLTLRAGSSPSGTDGRIILEVNGETETITINPTSGWMYFNTPSSSIIGIAGIDVVSGTGGSMSVYGGSSTDGSGGPLTISGGIGNNAGDGGDTNIFGGDANGSGAGGDITLTPGAGADRGHVVNAGAFRNVPFSVSSVAGQLDIDLSRSNVFYVTLTENVTVTNFNNPIAGQHFFLKIAQDAVGTWTFDWPASIKWDGAVNSPTVSTGSGKIDIYEFICIEDTTIYGRVFGQNMIIDP